MPTYPDWIRRALLSLLCVCLQLTQPHRSVADVTETVPWDHTGIRESVVLIGDTGHALPKVLEPLVSHVKDGPTDRTTIIFLGDNVYSRGIPATGDPRYTEAMRRLTVQLDAVRRTGARAVFVPGNHDWDYDGPRGQENVRNQESVVESFLGDGGFAPDDACPGPTTILSSAALKIVAINSQWWVHPYAKPDLESGQCGPRSQEEVLEALDRELGPEGSAFRILVQHHPLVSHGEHGQGAKCPWDLGCPTYKRFRTTLLRRLNIAGVELCASGHDHGLQVLRPPHGCDLHAVSGAGSHLGEVAAGRDTLFGLRANGFMRLDVREPNGSIVITVFTTGDEKHGAGAIPVYRLALR